MLENFKSFVLYICLIKMYRDGLCRGIHTNFSVKIYQLLKKLILNAHILLEEMSICSFHTTGLASNNSIMCFNYNGIGTSIC
jgi:hypothetical protein